MLQKKKPVSVWKQSMEISIYIFHTLPFPRYMLSLSPSIFVLFCFFKKQLNARNIALVKNNNSKEQTNKKLG